MRRQRNLTSLPFRYACSFWLVSLALASLSANPTKHKGCDVPFGPTKSSARAWYSDVYCISANDCWAVGAYVDGLLEKQLIVHWNGVSWIMDVGPNAGQIPRPQSVYCNSASDCWIVGRQFNDTTDRYETLTEHWNGSAWSAVSSPNKTATLENGLEGVFCNSSTDCWAAGWYGQESPYIPYQTLIEHWDGNVWSTVPSPNTSSGFDNVFYDVTCASSIDCWAVGNELYRTLTEHWNGTSWNVVASPTYIEANELYGVTCLSGSDCWAVGYYWAGSDQGLALKWDGASWTRVSTPGNGAYDLRSISCISSANCWAVGSEFYEVESATIVHWNGTSWTDVNLPVYDGFQGVFCTSNANCWAVGFDIYLNQILEHWDGQLWSFVTTAPMRTGLVSRKTHGSNQTFDLPMDIGAGIECRNGGANGSYQLVYTFEHNLTSVAGVFPFEGDVVSSGIGPNPNQYTINLTGLSQYPYANISLDMVQDDAGNFGTALGYITVLVGDVNGDGLVNSADIAQTKSQSGNTVTGANFVADVNIDGSINSADISLVKSKSGTALPVLKR